MSLPILRAPEDHPKGWGKEIYLANNEHYCGKLLCFNKGAKFSSHFHDLKIESFFLLQGEVKFSYIDPANANEFSFTMKAGTVVDIPRLCVHQVEAIQESVIIEISTQHLETDSYRVKKGDSQK